MQPFLLYIYIYDTSMVDCLVFYAAFNFSIISLGIVPATSRTEADALEPHRKGGHFYWKINIRQRGNSHIAIAYWDHTDSPTWLGQFCNGRLWNHLGKSSKLIHYWKYNYWIGLKAVWKQQLSLYSIKPFATMFEKSTAADASVFWKGFKEKEAWH